MKITLNPRTLERVKRIQASAEQQIAEITASANMRTSEILQAVVEATPDTDPKAVFTLKDGVLSDEWELAPGTTMRFAKPGEGDNDQA